MKFKLNVINIPEGKGRITDMIMMFFDNHKIE